MTTEHQNRHFEFKDDKSAKFWDVSLDGSVLTVRYGKIGVAGQSQTKEFDDAGAARKHTGKLVAEKVGKGYVELGSSTPPEPLEVAKPLSQAPPSKVTRVGSRKPATPNPAKDPEGGVEVPSLAHLSVEEVYERLRSSRVKVPAIRLLDLMTISGAGGSLGEAERGELQRHWRAALQQAGAVARRIGRGFGRAGLDAVREIDDATNPPLGWRELLWQFMVSTPFDFGGFDRRFIHRKLYLEDVVGEAVQVALCIDTSGSIGDAELGAFMSEVRGILDAYPQIRGHLFYADARLYGPHDFGADNPIPPARGGGGTSFRPFFEWMNQQERQGTQPLAIYLTDGYGDFPEAPPESPVMWVVNAGGLESTAFPFGQVVRMGT